MSKGRIEEPVSSVCFEPSLDVTFTSMKPKNLLMQKYRFQWMKIQESTARINNSAALS